MSLTTRLLSGVLIASTALLLGGCRGLVNEAAPPSIPPPPPGDFQIVVTNTGGSGTVTSTPAGVNCPQTCFADFTAGTQVTLTASPATTFSFGGWSGGCTGTSTTCAITLSDNSDVTALFSGSLQSINHIIFMAQENRSFDEYFGAMQLYWRQNGFPDQPFDGLVQFSDLASPPPALLGCDPAFPFSPPPAPEVNCTIDSSSPLISSFHTISQCTENPSPSWNESHVDWNLNDAVSPTPTMDGFVKTAANDARRDSPPLNDTDGIRAMGYYTGDDLPYYYFMASNFATSDRWFSPAMSRTQVNRMYLVSGTSSGHAYPLATTSTKMTNKTIFELLQNAGISWRIYVTDGNNPLFNGSEESMYTFSNTHQANFVPASQFFTDLQTNNLPSVVEIDPGFVKGTDEHSGENPAVPSGGVQTGASYVSTLINALMQSPYWKDSVFILTWDEAGGFYDHVPPQPMPSPDGIPPSDLLPDDICTQSTGPTCDFVYTGFRVPLIVISPFSRKNYVSHTVADYTAILKFIETRFGLPNLTQRDNAQIDMTEFFDFTNVPWAVPPTSDQIPVQQRTLPCEYTQLQ